MLFEFEPSDVRLYVPVVLGICTQSEVFSHWKTAEYAGFRKHTGHRCVLALTTTFDGTQASSPYVAPAFH